MKGSTFTASHGFRLPFMSICSVDCKKKKLAHAQARMTLVSTVLSESFLLFVEEGMATRERRR